MQGAQCPPSPSASEPPKSKDSKIDESIWNTKAKEPNILRAPNIFRMDTKRPTTVNFTKEESQKSVGAKRQQSKSIDSDNRSDCSPSPASVQFDDKCSACGICGMAFASPNGFADHHKCHNEEDIPKDNKGYLCKLCGKIFNSKAGLERHAEVHCGERPFNCKICDLSFDTVSKMHRHERAHKYLGNEGTNYESDESSESSSEGDRKQREQIQRFAKKRPNMEYNNNGKTDGKKKARTINNNFMNEFTSQRLTCPVCERDDFITINALETHLDENHPEYQIKCAPCNVSFKNYKVYNIHRQMVHYADKMNTEVNSNPDTRSFTGFNDLTFIDFSSQKFPQIASSVCGQSVHKSVSEQLFTCRTCTRDFPCESALDIHRQTCFLKSTKEICDLMIKKRTISESTEEDIKREDFFAKLDLQNKSIDSSPHIDQTPIETRMPRLQKELMFPNKDYMRPLIHATKDLADIQSIINVTSSGGLLEQLTCKTHDTDPLTPPDMMIKENEGEETQDQFAAEFRKMKLRGEFPCRLCPAKFPNLRALKGHNRVHLSGNGPGPYRCNMCPHSSLDKAALIRHMRTHNGDRPYECAVCNYAFTTKANCERHLRNRHSKVTREDVKRSIIYHPSEDPNNDEVNSKLNISREEIKRSLVFNTPPDSDRREDTERNIGDRSTPLSHYTREQTLPFVKERTLNIQIPRDISIIVPQPRDILRNHVIDTPNMTPQDEPVRQPRIKVKGFGQLTQIPEFQNTANDNRDDSEEDLTNGSYENRPMNFSSDGPMDLSTTDNNEDVLDLSKKRNYPDSDTHTDTEPEKYPEPEFHENSTTASMIERSQQFLLAQQHLLNNVQMPKLDPATAFFASQLSQIYRTGITGIPGLGLPSSFPINPYFLQQNPFLTPPSNSQDIAEMKERIQKEMMIIRGLQMSGGGLVNMDPSNVINNLAFASDRLQAMHHHTLNNASPIPEIPKVKTPVPIIKIEDDKPLHINTDSTISTPFSNSVLPQSPKLHKRESITSHSPNSVKMVIKNGVLMPKQKQRRYRTERPFSCEHCSARFTLRSNMERHIKQQHPQYWSQRQRANIGNFPRKPSLTIISQSMPVANTNYDGHLQFLKNLSENGSHVDTNDYLPGLPNNQPGTPQNKPYLMSDQMKYALLAQQLNNHQNSFSAPPPEYSHDSESVKGEEMELEEEEDALIIDEEEDSHEIHKIDENTASTGFNVESNFIAKKVAQEILIGVSAKQQDLTKDFDLKIAGNLINKNRNIHVSTAIIPTLVSQFNRPKSEIQNNSVDLTTEKSTLSKSPREEGDLVPVSRLLDNAASQLPFGQYFKLSTPEHKNVNDTLTVVPLGEGSEEDEEGLVASSGSTIEGNSSGSDENRYESDAANQPPAKKKSAYSLAPNRVSCPYCHRKFPWSSSLRRHVLTHTGQKPFKCPHCPLLFTTKSNCDRHLLRKHGGQGGTATPNTVINSPQHIEETLTSKVATPSNIIPIPGLGSHGFMMRNVPERPYKCASCPSSTFSTLSNLKKHMSSKHGIIIPDSRPNSPFHEIEDHLTSDDEKISRSVKDESERTVDTSKNFSITDSSGQKSEWDLQIAANKLASCENLGNVTQQNSELPFKCHLCDGSYGERHEALDHIKDCHTSEYNLLMYKGALETSCSLEENIAGGNKSESCEEQIEENIDSLRGKFPDYANRKVVCAFCMRRFWSAEDLRRHMRTHTGEKPFSCDICRRRFTLKHSMIRHQKKHQENTTKSTSGEDFSPTSGDDEIALTFESPLSNQYSSSIIKTSTPISSKPITLNGYQFAVSNKNVSISPEIPSNVNNNNSPPSYEDEHLKIKIEPSILNDRRFSDDNMENGNDLIGNLLGISDRGIINKLLSSADEAAKLLGVNK